MVFCPLYSLWGAEWTGNPWLAKMCRSGLHVPYQTILNCGRLLQPNVKTWFTKPLFSDTPPTVKLLFVAVSPLCPLNLRPYMYNPRSKQSFLVSCTKKNPMGLRIWGWSVPVIIVSDPKPWCATMTRYHASISFNKRLDLILDPLMLITLM